MLIAKINIYVVSLLKMSSSGDKLSWGCFEQTVDKGILPWDVTVQVWVLIS